MRRLRRKYRILFVLSVAIAVLDQVSKFIIVDRFRFGESLSIVAGYFNLTHIRNTGAAFGIFAQAEPAFRIPFFIVVPVIALVAIAYVFKRIPDQDVKLSVALSLVVGGAIGNLIDRVSLGYVVDFLLFHWQYRYYFPAFNVADSAICTGVGILMLDLLFQKQELDEQDRNNQTETSSDAPASS